jgi:hypothetical protein
VLSGALRASDIHEGAAVTTDRALKFLFLEVAKLEDQDLDPPL